MDGRALTVKSLDIIHGSLYDRSKGILLAAVLLIKRQ